MQANPAPDMGALIIRIGFGGPLYCNYNQEPPPKKKKKNSSDHEGSYSSMLPGVSAHEEAEVRFLPLGSLGLGLWFTGLGFRVFGFSGLGF